MPARRWRTLNELRDAYAASGLELARKTPSCRGKVRYGNEDEVWGWVLSLQRLDDEHAARSKRLNPYGCRWCGGWHIGHQPRPHGRRFRKQRMH